MYGLIKMQNPGLPAEENLSETVFGEMDKNKVWHSKSILCDNLNDWRMERSPVKSSPLPA